MTKEFYETSLNIRARSNIELANEVAKRPNLKELYCSGTQIFCGNSVISLFLDTNNKITTKFK